MWHRSDENVLSPEHPPVFRVKPRDYLALLWRAPLEILRAPLTSWRGARRLLLSLPRNLREWEMTLLGAGFALLKAKEFRRRGYDIVHGPWATAPATAAAVLSTFCACPFSMGAHAYDIYRFGGDRFLKWKLGAAAFVHTTTEAAVDYLTKLRPQSSSKILLIRRGLDALPEIPRRNRLPGEPLRLLSVGRLVAKKGQDKQITACARLRDQGMPFILRIVGDGPLKESLERLAAALGISNNVELPGAMNPSNIQEMYAWADVFLHTGIVDPEGDRDGLPNVIPEAFAWALPVVCGQTPGATEAIKHGKTGMIVDISNPQTLAEVICVLKANANLRKRLGAKGRAWVEENFMTSRNAALLAAAFRNAARKKSEPLARN
jgi:glycosyltransferase involved in cell wall biosynthesis